MNIFYAAVEDDPLDGGGRVIDGGSCGTVTGEDGKRRRLAFLGQQAFCGKCNTAGIIAAAPGSPYQKRLNDQRNGRRQALGGDLVLCKCERHPRIVPLYGRRMKITDENSTATVRAQSVAQSPTYDDRFVLRDSTGHALAYTAYALCRDSGAFEYGETDAQGHTHLLTSITSAENINVYVAG